MSSIDLQDDPWGRRWCHAPRRDARSSGWSRTFAGQAGRPIRDGIACMLVAALLFASGAATARFASGAMNTSALVFWTNLFCFLIMGAWCALRPPQGGIATKRLGLHVLRSVFTYGALLTYFYAIATIPFANAVVLQSLGPVFVPVLALVVLRRLSDRSVWIGVVISFAGVALVIPPGRLGMSIGDLAALLAAVGGAAAALVIWSLSTTEPAQRQMFYFSLFAVVLAAVPLPWTWQTPRAIELVQIGVTAAFIIAGQYFYAKAFILAPGDKVNTWSYMSIVFAAIIGRAVWAEPILVTTCVGAALIVLGARLASRTRPERAPACRSGTGTDM
ncbi:DMT family transporter [Labrys wisconsinensis]|uniref:Drug/metabolite transporter (DMT)-like permease n=1 Tax=Labrys wisconsinensis TaxID=425677 RepID=A0ABU0JNI8_9HYPH|nr:DMT family transporter [Labrys wisconsinensis]MDQ0474707.1 drug/metabolite transporter (DMT)-like permease [Labrys wisconsinensis]